jgi:hypothetical protein
MKCNILVFYIYGIILISVIFETQTFTMEETFQLRNSICNKVASCQKCTPSRGKNLKSSDYKINDFVSYNVLSYEVPFMSGTEYFANPCNCEKISRVKKFCKDLDKSDPLPGLRNVDLRGILVKDDDSINSQYRFRQRDNTFLKKKNFISDTKTKKTKHECDCMNENDRQSLFCHDQCKLYTEYMIKVRSFYDKEVKETEAWFDREMNKLK